VRARKKAGPGSFCAFRRILVALQTKYAPQGLQVISVNTDGEYREGEAEILAGIEALVQKAVASAPRSTPATPAPAKP
jgi:hypothetical protein